MKFLILLLPFLLCASPPYPFIFSSISDKIYQHLDGYKELVSIEYFSTNCPQLKEYINELELLKKEGFRLETNSSISIKSAYAKTIRNQEKKINSTNNKINKELAKLFINREYSVLILLKDSSLEFVKNSYEVNFTKEAYESPSRQSKKVESQISLESSFGILKDKLIQSRDVNNPLCTCLNDITSINHYMIKIDKEILKNNPCQALKYIGNLQEYDRSSQVSCKEDISYYDKWHAKSLRYRTTLLIELRSSCLLK